MRWVALGVDYEMAGKDLIDSVKLSGEICRALGGTPPEGFNYELFLDENGQKISKSKGNGLTIDEWLRYASPESLSLFMYREPKAAKRLYFDVIPRHVDEYLQFLDAYPRQDAEGAARQSGLAHPRRRAAEGRQSGAVRHAAVAGHRVECRERRNAVGLHRPLSAGRDEGDASASRRDGRIRHPLFPRFRAAGEKIPRAGTDRARGADRPARCAVATCRPTRRRKPSRTWSTRSAAASRSSMRRKRARTASPASRSTGSTCSIRCCSARSEGPRFGSFAAAYGIKNTIDMIDGALARSA